MRLCFLELLFRLPKLPNQLCQPATTWYIRFMKQFIRQLFFQCGDFSFLLCHELLTLRSFRLERLRTVYSFQAK